MGECRDCDLSYDGTVNFCPRCGSPQNEQAAEHLEAYVQQQVEQTDDGDTGKTRTLYDRLSYVAGYVTIVLGLAQSSMVAASLLVAGGLAVLPPFGAAVERLTGHRLPYAPRFAVLLALLVVSVVVSRPF